MRIAKGTVVDGRIVVEGEPLREGSTVTVLVPGEGLAVEQDGFTLSADEEAALLGAIGEADRGELLDAEDVMKRLA